MWRSKSPPVNSSASVDFARAAQKSNSRSPAMSGRTKQKCERLESTLEWNCNAASGDWHPPFAWYSLNSLSPEQKPCIQLGLPANHGNDRHWVTCKILFGWRHSAERDPWQFRAETNQVLKVRKKRPDGLAPFGRFSEVFHGCSASVRKDRSTPSKSRSSQRQNSL